MSDTIERLRQLSSANLGRTASDDEAIDGVCESAIEEIEGLRKALGCVSRMRVFPDAQINMVTLTAAIQLAEKALENG